MNNEQKKEKVQVANEALKALQEWEQSLKAENLIKDNTIKFKVKDVDYRVRLPDSDEQQILEEQQRRKYLELVKDDSFLFRKQWIEQYKKKGIDIDKMEQEIKTLDSEIKKLLLKLAQTQDKKGIKELKEDINKLRDKQYQIVIEKTNLLGYSIEDQLQIHVNSYTAFLVLEKKVENKWIKCFEKYEDFMNCKDVELINQTFGFLNYLVYNRE